MANRATPADILVGHSWGGAAVLAAARQSPGVRSVVTVAAPIDPSHVEKHYDAVVDCVLSEGSAEWMVGGRTLTLKRAFVEDVRAADLHDKIKGLRLPLLILHSPTDNTVGIENASEIFRLARHPRSFVSLEGSDHLLTARGQAHRAGRIIGAWADAYLDDPR
jgi:pimeloyl-ACP methyl ester carboxylesterase